MSFQFTWPTFDDSFVERVREELTKGLNIQPPPPPICDTIRVQELFLGNEAPVLEIMEVSDLTEDRFRGIFRFSYSGDAHIVLQTKVQANPVTPSKQRTRITRHGILAAHTPLIVPMTLKLSALSLRGVVLLVLDRHRGVTLWFKHDPLRSVKVTSTFDNVSVLRDLVQRKIEDTLRRLFLEQMPTMVHDLSEAWRERADGETTTDPTYHADGEDGTEAALGKEVDAGGDGNVNDEGEKVDPVDPAFAFSSSSPVPSTHSMPHLSTSTPATRTLDAQQSHLHQCRRADGYYESTPNLDVDDHFDETNLSVTGDGVAPMRGPALRTTMFVPRMNDSSMSLHMLGASVQRRSPLRYAMSCEEMASRTFGMEYGAGTLGAGSLGTLRETKRASDVMLRGALLDHENPFSSTQEQAFISVPPLHDQTSALHSSSSGTATTVGRSDRTAERQPSYARYSLARDDSLIGMTGDTGLYSSVESIDPFPETPQLPPYPILFRPSMRHPYFHLFSRQFKSYNKSGEGSVMMGLPEEWGRYVHPAGNNDQVLLYEVHPVVTSRIGGFLHDYPTILVKPFDTTLPDWSSHSIFDGTEVTVLPNDETGDRHEEPIPMETSHNATTTSSPAPLQPRPQNEKCVAPFVTQNTAPRTSSLPPSLPPHDTSRSDGRLGIPDHIRRAYAHRRANSEIYTKRDMRDTNAKLNALPAGPPKHRKRSLTMNTCYRSGSAGASLTFSKSRHQRSRSRDPTRTRQPRTWGVPRAPGLGIAGDSIPMMSPQVKQHRFVQSTVIHRSGVLVQPPSQPYGEGVSQGHGSAGTTTTPSSIWRLIKETGNSVISSLVPDNKADSAVVAAQRPFTLPWQNYDRQPYIEPKENTKTAEMKTLARSGHTISPLRLERNPIQHFSVYRSGLSPVHQKSMAQGRQ